MGTGSGAIKLGSFRGLPTLGSGCNYGSNRVIQSPLHKLSKERKSLRPTFAITAAAAPSIEPARRLVGEFNPGIPIEEADTPPSSWYTDPSFYSLELDRVFYRGWQAVGYAEQIKDAHDYFTGRLGSIEYVVCRDGKGKLHAFHNVCRHHASLLACGNGQKSCFVCPYHGWTYGLDGALLKATRITEKQKLNTDEFGLLPINVAIWGPFVLVNFDEALPLQAEFDGDSVGHHWLGACSKMLSVSGVDTALSYVCRRAYTIECNWKVFCDNYLDGGYHVPYAHRGLSSGLNFETYTTEIFEKVSIQRCESSTTTPVNDISRLGSEALYAFIYPNFMINRYGPWMDTNLVIPLGPRKCKVVFDYFLDPSLKASLVSAVIVELFMVVRSHTFVKSASLISQFKTPHNSTWHNCCYTVSILQRDETPDDKSFIENSLKDSEQVQIEDIVLCENVQLGLESPAYNCGKYAANVEEAMHHFHCLLHQNLTG